MTYNLWRNWWVVLVMVVAGCTTGSARVEERGAGVGGSKPLKLLAIGNSFTGNATEFLPELAESGGKQLEMTRALIGGASLERHVKAMEAFAADPQDAAGRPYRHDLADRVGAWNRAALVELLAADDWDIVTIQQVSRYSFRPETYEPFAGELISAIRAHAPTAEVVVLQTWTYRDDMPLLAEWGLTPEQMYEGLRDAYDQLAERYGLRQVPVGDAFQIAGAQPRWQPLPRDEGFDYQSPAPGTLPRPRGGLWGGYRGHTDAETGVYRVGLDGFHANAAGKYLGAAVMYQVLFEDELPDAAFVPDTLTAEAAASLREAAAEAVEARAAVAAR